MASNGLTVRRTTGGAFVAALFFSLLSKSASAAPTAAEKESARRFMDEGRAFLRNNDPEHAVESFARAHAIMHVPTTGLALAKAYVETGQLVEARDAALEAARVPQSPGEPAVFEEARTKAQELEERLKPRVPLLRVKVNLSGAKVEVDGKELPAALIGTTAAVNPGHHVVKATRGSDTKTGEIDLAEGEEKEISLVLVEIVNSAAEENGQVKTILRPSKGGLSPLTITGIAVGGAGLVVGTVTGLMTIGSAQDIQKSCLNGRCDPAIRNELDRSNTLALVSTVAFGVGIVGGGLTLIGALTSGTRTTQEAQRTPPHTHVSPWIKPSLGLDGGTIGVRGGFW